MKKMSKFRMMMKNVRIQEEDEKEDVSPQMKRKITLHQSRYFSEPSGLETPSKYEY
jgi:hypothetical protein